MAYTDEYEELAELSVIGFHVNSVVVIIGLLAYLFMFFHALYEWKWKQCAKQSSASKKSRPVSPGIIYSSLIVLFLNIVMFMMYFIDFFFLRMFPPNSFNYSSFTFCKSFTKLLFISMFAAGYSTLHYFLR